MNIKKIAPPNLTSLLNLAVIIDTDGNIFFNKKLTVHKMKVIIKHFEKIKKEMKNEGI